MANKPRRGKGSGWNKYNAKPCDVEGRTKPQCEKLGIPFVKRWASLSEFRRNIVLMEMVKKGEIKNLVSEKLDRYYLIVNGIKITYYTPDFEYDLADGTHVVEDVKSERTAAARDFRMRMNLMKACRGITVNEVYM